MTDIDRATALALIAGRLSDYPVIRRLPDDLKAELEPLERGKHYGGIIERLADDIQPVSADYNMDFLVPLLHAIRSAAKAQESRLAALGRELENAVHRNRELRAALAKSAEEIAALKPARLPDGGSRYAVRRAVLDEKTCDFCRLTDGAAGPVPPVDCEHAADPDSDEHCRCVMVAAP